MLKLRRKPQRNYPDSDRFGEDGLRLYSAYEAAKVRQRLQQGGMKRIRAAAIVLAAIAFVLLVIAFQLPGG
ncbi:MULTISPECIES: hypothetical protein [unclassified Mesorhizobium]|uniref:hypothetical protein n=1 Tax=unclassified Mesorhizobium TaxID=325217 RepID=UPI000FCA93F0|nr:MULTISPECIES: hypothetical protein [unclassified Mesorhizobium]RUW67824.1 hypothetical protein EOA31_27640 [Mesorhizobium sp. M4B.F.Ca.ET.049.02.1.2]RWC96422.1 MAG: hypothetical protein EOS32_08650 [Mesorhizobium sp.]TGV26136.1 hypothetical protein EN786_11390 [Mesorhizobium sp. M4B.F.Ca.ET.143.01.1.1]TIW74907.1 MAG: hypothetical protein E5V58_04010 [Mesorhizobium sp.]